MALYAFDGTWNSDHDAGQYGQDTNVVKFARLYDDHKVMLGKNGEAESVKHLPAYVDEIAFKFNNRDNPYLFRDTLLRLIDGETLPLKELANGK